MHPSLYTSPEALSAVLDYGSVQRQRMRDARTVLLEDAIQLRKIKQLLLSMTNIQEDTEELNEKGRWFNGWYISFSAILKIFT